MQGLKGWSYKNDPDTHSEQLSATEEFSIRAGVFQDRAHQDAVFFDPATRDWCIARRTWVSS